eukprot:15366679-Ditylum_brightwellii.AAC.2
MTNGKAPGPFSITSYALKFMVWTEMNPNDEHENDNANYLITIIHAMILEFWEGMLDFKSWKSGTLAPVPKKSDLSNPNKWYPVGYLPHLSAPQPALGLCRTYIDHGWAYGNILTIFISCESHV